MEVYEEWAVGAAHGALFGVFAVAACGKLVGCRYGSRAMCRKALCDSVIAIGACFIASPYIAPVIAAVATVIGIGGWLRERISESKVCNCFGVLTIQLDVLRNPSRALMALSGIMSLLLNRGGDAQWGNSTYAGALGSLIILLLALAWAFASSSLPGKTKLVVQDPGDDARAELVFDPSLNLGSPGGEAIPLAQLLGPQMTAFLLVADGCEHCEQLKKNLVPLQARLPIALHIVGDKPGKNMLGGALLHKSGHGDD